MQFIQANWPTIIAPLLVAAIDFAWALAPNLKANGLLHALYKAIGGKDPQPPASG